jgi:two-component system, chemotaxis family, CheB/CheR fusion protein
MAAKKSLPRRSGKRRVRTGRRSGPRKIGIRRTPADAEPRTGAVADTEPAVEVSRPPILVGVGASAGGLEAFTQLLQALPTPANLAFVLVQHLSPQHESALPALLSTKTKLRVVPVTDGVHVESNHVYVIPPNVHITVTDSRLHLLPRPYDRTQYTPVDFFFESLARAHQNRAIGIVLSGTASDGAAGVRAIKAVGGITIAQRPSTAKYDGMPKAAISTGMVDLVLTPSEIAERLTQVQKHPYLAELPRPGGDLALSEDNFAQIFAALRRTSGVDFSRYKPATVRRRVLRRMALHRVSDVEMYVNRLRSDRQELTALYQDLFIHVTRFFRDPDSFEALKSLALPQLASRQANGPLRVWVPGCATGEEAYSLAIVLLESLNDQQVDTRVQIFATDVSESAIEHARAGVYPPTIVSDISPERFKRHFTKIDGGFKVSKALRDMCIFARHDLTRDPPFSRLDLIVCRNVLIYLDAELQKRLMSVFHYALNPSGFLMLGPAETTGHQSLFTIVDKKWRIYSKANVGVSMPMGFAADRLTGAQAAPSAIRAPELAEGAKSVQEEASRVLLQRYAPAGVLIDGDFQIVQFRGQTGRYLEPASGEPSLNLLKMAKEGLLHALRGALSTAKRKHRSVRIEKVPIRHNGEWIAVNVEVVPLSSGRHLLVLFEEINQREPETAAARTKRLKPTPRRGTDDRVSKLTRELSASREYLQSIIQELEAANEELQSANEEILSSNEELQSTNEELDTAKEELQSTNEELNTLNEELHSRNEELSRVNSDLINLLASVEITIAIIGDDLRIRRFTPKAEQVLNLIPTDIGRPIEQINPTIAGADIGSLVRQAIDRVRPLEREVQDRSGRWFSLRVRPYKNVDNRIEGAVLALIDIDAAKRHEMQTERSRDYFLAIVQTVRQPLLVLDRDLRVKTANKAFYETFGGQPQQTENVLLRDLGDGLWTAEPLQALLSRVTRGEDPVQNVVVNLSPSHRSHKRILVSAHRLPQDDAAPWILVAIEVQDVASTNAEEGA